MASAAMDLQEDPEMKSVAAQHVPRWVVGAFAATILVVYFCTLGRFALAEPDEPRYAEIAREMLLLRDWVTPHLNYVKYFEKPPLIYWLTAINLQLFGTSEFVARFWPALFAAVGIWMTYVVGCSMYGPWVGAVGAAILASAPFYFGLSQVLVLDMPLAGLMTLAIGSFWLAHTRPAQRGRFTMLLYIATALAVLTKGPVAIVLTGGVIIGFLALRGDLWALRWLLSPTAIAIFLAVTLPWFVLVSWRNPEFIDFFIVKQHLERFLISREHRQPLWFFVPIVFGGMLPWTLIPLFAPGRVAAFARRLAQRRTSAAALYCILWSGIIFVFFSLSGSKLATYILPVFAPVAILLARFLQILIGENEAAPLVRTCAFLITFGALATVGAYATNQVLDQWEVGYVVKRIYVGAPLLAVAGAMALVLIRRMRLQAGITLLVIAMFALEMVAITGRGLAVHYRSLGTVIRSQARPGDQIIVYKHYVQGIPFYSRRRVIMVGAWGELNFGRLQGDQREFFWETDAQLLDAWRSGRHVFLVINRVELEPLRLQLHPVPREIAAHDKKVVLVNFN